MDVTFSGSKKLFSGPFVSFTTGSCLGLQSSAMHILSGQMEGLIPQAIAPATHSLCFSSSEASGSDLQKHILPDLLLVLNTRYIPWTPPHGVSGPGGLGHRAVHFVQCTNAWRDGQLFPAWQAVPQRGAVSPRKVCLLANQLLREAAVFCNLHRDTVVSWQVLVGVVYFCILIVSSGSWPRVSIVFVLPTVLANSQR